MIIQDTESGFLIFYEHCIVSHYLELVLGDKKVEKQRGGKG